MVAVLELSMFFQARRNNSAWSLSLTSRELNSTIRRDNSLTSWASRMNVRDMTEGYNCKIQRKFSTDMAASVVLSRLMTYADRDFLSMAEISPNISPANSSPKDISFPEAV